MSIAFQFQVYLHKFTFHLERMKVYFNQYGKEKPTWKSQHSWPRNWMWTLQLTSLIV